MVVDRWPQEFIYISKRLLAERWQQHNAAAKRIPSTVKIKTPIAESEFSLGSTGEDNPFWLARTVTQAIKGYTGSFLRPNIYVRGVCEMHWGVVTILREPYYQVAWFASVLETQEGPIFVALCGSEHNFLSYAGEPNLPPFKRHASSVEGMARIIRAAWNDLTPEEIPPEAGPESRSAVEEAFLISRVRPYEEVTVGTVEALFQRIHYEEDIELPWDNRTYRAGIIGVPLWVATANPKSFR